MPVIEIGDGNYAIICTRGSGKQKYCQFCDSPSNFLCDYPVGSGTCDKRICVKCTTRVRYGIDYCPEHKDCEVN